MEKSNMSATKDLNTTKNGAVNQSLLNTTKVAPNAGKSTMQGSRMQPQTKLQKQEITLQQQVFEKPISTVETTRLQQVFDMLCGNEGSNRESGKHDEGSSRKNFFTAKDVMQVLQDLKYPCTKAEVDKMIWQVDDNLDYQIDFHEFILMYKRCRFDQTGLQPRSLYNVVLFLMFLKSELQNEGSDKEEQKEKLTITQEDTLELLYVRFGRTHLDREIEEIFGKEDLNNKQTNQEKEINLKDFLEKQRKRDFENRQLLENDRKTVKLPDKESTQF